MPATVRGLYRPRRRLIKPRGTPRIIRSLAPRGLQYSFPLGDQRWGEAAFGVPLAAQSGFTLAGTVRGLGAKTGGGVAYASVAKAVQPPQTWSLEALVYINSTTLGYIAGWCQVNDGNSGTVDRQLFIDGTGAFAAYLFDGGTKRVTGGAASAGSIVHLCATCDAGAGSGTLRLYVNGAQPVGGTAVSNGGYTSYATPEYFIVGRSSNGGGPIGTNNAYDGTILLCNFANVCWTPTEVQARYANPFGFLEWPEDRRHYLVGVASGATSYSFPTAGWVWNHQAPTLAFASTSTQKAWAWNHQAPTLAFATAAAQKAWAWAKGAPSLGFASAATQKAWAWVGGAPILPRTIAAAQKAWRWAAASPTMTGGNFNPLAAVLRYLGPVWKRRRSRPPL